MRNCPVCESDQRVPFDRWTADQIVERFPDSQLVADATGGLDLVRCGNCGMCYIPDDFDPNRLRDQAPPLDRTEFITEFRDTPPSYLSLRNQIVLTTYRLAVSHFPSIRLLDFGSTRYASYLRWASYYPNTTTVAYDVHVAPGEVDGISFHNDLHRVKALGPFEAIICNQVIEHCVDPQRELENIRELLRPEGVAFLALPLVNYTKLAYYRSTGYSGEIAHDIFTPLHLNYYSPSLFVRAVRKARLGILPVQLDFTVQYQPPRSLFGLVRQSASRFARYAGFRAMLATNRFPDRAVRLVNGFFVTRSS